ncbi:MAG: flagellar basal body-associated FliL family protein [candidate division FCPU426 bacterium]
MAEDSKKLQIVIGLLSALLALVVGLGVLQYILLSRHGEGPRQKVIEPRPQLGRMEKLGSFLVNLGDTEETHYLRAVIEIEQNFGSSPEFGNEIGNRKSQLRDLVIATLSGKNSAELRTPEGKEGLKQELKERVNSVLSKGQIARVYFTEFAVQ